jgi:hypothetical protein
VVCARLDPRCWRPENGLYRLPWWWRPGALRDQAIGWNANEGMNQMTRIGSSRRAAVTVVCMGTVLAAPSGAMALTTHSATTSTLNTAGQLVATAKCGANARVVSGGYKTSDTSDPGGAVVSRAVKPGWTVRFYPFGADTLTTYAYCAPTGQFSLSKHENNVAAKPRVKGHANTTVTARCAAGETLVSGGYAFLPSSSQSNSPTYRDYSPSGGKWTVMSDFNTTPAMLAAFAYCGRGVVVKVRSSSSASIPPGGDGSARASCHREETLLAGGYTTTPTPDVFNSTGPDLFYSGSHRSGAHSWTASAHNFSSVAGKIQTFAYCMP